MQEIHPLQAEDVLVVQGVVEEPSVEVAAPVGEEEADVLVAEVEVVVEFLEQKVVSVQQQDAVAEAAPEEAEGVV